MRLTKLIEKQTHYWACPKMAPLSQITTATENEAYPFYLLGAVLA